MRQSRFFYASTISHTNFLIFTNAKTPRSSIFLDRASKCITFWVKTNNCCTNIEAVHIISSLHLSKFGNLSPSRRAVRYARFFADTATSMTDNIMEEYEVFLKEAGIRCAKWLNHIRSGSWSYPVLLFNARQRDASHISHARSGMKNTAAYQNASVDDAQRMLDGAADQAMQESVQDGNGFRILASKFGHKQVNGKFVW